MRAASGQLMAAGEEHLAAFTKAVRLETGHQGRIEAFAFGDSPALADELARLVLEGPKRATAAWVADDGANEDPRPGDHWIVLDGHERPVCAVVTDEVTVRAFDDVDPALAWDEGEGDRTLEDWRAQHRAYFERRADLHGIPFTGDAQVRLERFRLVHPPPEPPAPVVSRGEVVVRDLQPAERPWLQTVLAGRGADADVLERTGGFPADACPALVARHRGQTAGVLVFRPHPDGVETVWLAVLDEDADTEAALHEAVEELARRYRWSG